MSYEKDVQQEQMPLITRSVAAILMSTQKYLLKNLNLEYCGMNMDLLGT